MIWYHTTTIALPWHVVHMSFSHSCVYVNLWWMVGDRGATVRRNGIEATATDDATMAIDG